MNIILPVKGRVTQPEVAYESSLLTYQLNCNDERVELSLAWAYGVRSVVTCRLHVLQTYQRCKDPRRRRQLIHEFVRGQNDFATAEPLFVEMLPHPNQGATPVYAARGLHNRMYLTALAVDPNRSERHSSWTNFIYRSMRFMNSQMLWLAGYTVVPAVKTHIGEDGLTYFPLDAVIGA